MSGDANGAQEELSLRGEGTLGCDIDRSQK